MKYNLLCFQISGRLIIFFNKYDYQVLTSLIKENKRYKRLKTAKWISIRKLVPGLLLTVRSAGLLSSKAYNNVKLLLVKIVRIPYNGVVYTDADVLYII